MLHLIAPGRIKQFDVIKGEFSLTESSILPTSNTPLSYILIFASHQSIDSPDFPSTQISNFLKNKCFIVYICDRLPDNPIQHDNIVYAELHRKYIHFGVVKEAKKFSGVLGISDRGIHAAKAFSRKHNVQYISLQQSTFNLEERLVQQKATNILFDTLSGCPARGFGDILIMTPLFKKLKKLYPESKLVFCGRKQAFPLLYGNPYIDECVDQIIDSSVVRKGQDFSYHYIVGQRLEDYDNIVNKGPRIDALCNFLDIPLEDGEKNPEIYLSVDETSSGIISTKTSKINLGINIEATSGTRRWSEKRLRELIRKLDPNKFRIHLFGTKKILVDDSTIFNHTGRFSLREYLVAISKIDLLICTDSLTSHIGAAFKIPSIILYSQVPAEWRCKYYKNVYPIQSSKECSPCIGTDNKFSKPSCFDDCLDGVTVEAIIAKIKEIEDRNGDLKVRRKILINRTSGLGDILMLTSVIHQFKKLYPEYDITIRTNHDCLFFHNSDVATIVKATSRDSELTEDFEKIVDFNYCVESTGVAGDRGKITDEDYMNVTRLELFFRFANLEIPKHPRLIYKVTKKEKEWAEKIWLKLQNKYRVVYVVNSTSPFRTYPAISAIELLKKLTNSNYNVISVGDHLELWGEKHTFNQNFVPAEKLFNKEAYKSCVSKTTLRQVIALIAQADLVITGDTGLLHAANAVNTPCIGLFGNINPKLRCYYYANTQALYKELPCSKECGDRGRLMYEGILECPSFYLINRDAAKTFIGAKCMHAITPYEIFNLAESVVGADCHNKEHTLNILPLIVPYLEGEGLQEIGEQDGYDKQVTACTVGINEKDKGKYYQHIYSSCIIQGKTHEEINDWIEDKRSFLKIGGYLIVTAPLKLSGNEEKLSGVCIGRLVESTKNFKIVFEQRIINKNYFVIVAKRIK